MKFTYRNLLAVLWTVFSICPTPTQAQLTWAQDVIIEGDLNVGTTGTSGNILVTGKTGNSAAPSLKVTGDGGVVFMGVSGTGQIPVTGAGTRMMWYPKKAALRAGTADYTEWDDANIGYNSIAFGGFGTSASGAYAFAVGERVNASGDLAVALGTFSNATGVASTAFGESTLASGFLSTAMGSGTVSSGWNATSMGEMTLAYGHVSFASGSGTIASGDYTNAAGYGTTALAAYSFVVGRFNEVDGDQGEWIETDPLFVVGNGTGDAGDPAKVRNRNALTVYKNGKIKMERQGDILMGEFGNPE